MSHRLSDLAAAIDARRVGADAEFLGAAIDSRAVVPGHLFFALAGEHTDGHCFVEAAVRAGAAAVVVSAPQPIEAPQLVVDDPVTALRATGAFVRHRFAGVVIGVTGSNGKTTVKQMLGAVMAEAGSVHASSGNLNNELGVPMTLAGLADQASAVIEMAAGGPGDIAELARIVEPDVALVTNAGRAHLERFGTVDAVATTKSAIYEHLGAEGVAVINLDDAYARFWSEQAGSRRVVTFALEADGADITAHDVITADDGQSTHFQLQTPMNAVQINIPLAGRHNVRNALAAAAAAHARGVTPQQIAGGLAAVQGEAGRLRHLVGGVGGAEVVDDSYNANPESLTSALDWLAARSAPRWLVLGDMAELGAEAGDMHAEAGEMAARAGVDHLWTVGELSRRANAAFTGEAAHYDDLNALIAALRVALEDVAQPPTILVKGSRSAGMERVVAAIGPAGVQEASPC
ncbi:UDP-N-acetylmuramoyl-tripeptide--D-alanyl-D-alanine ligase [Salinisphaera sp. USBA-960]|uniref:UDP-N-acetylmuramoyl-tripeptide--D-alanyl-D- alanine ligase n=1 Tax=Salinisphaera orenii TaxID=856731 RepID=UPI000DBE7DE0|nr:UDP-N-acetylmuramoyl-tripeptide--D-alanyl-D-alanine ligase [Salifodinibacter halophilus]NNC26762.1 UDP-N-acetylmuramoyl-tripeptide--D-alanyl-D-alanine ligase [Salifodinibacter halophilus]